MLICRKCDGYDYCVKNSAGTYSPFRAYWLSDAPTGLTFSNGMLCPHYVCVFMCHVFIWEQTTTSAPYNINWLVFIT